jgi:hypothetical protein
MPRQASPRDSLKIGDVQTGSSKTLTVTFSNSGSDPTIITNLSISGDSEFFLGPGLTRQQGTNGLIVPTVVGAPDDTWVESVTAFVTLRPGASASEDELRPAVRARLAGYKVPKTVQVIDAIPMSPVGKVLRRALREPLWNRQ